jgi:hypothetical protein
MKPRLAGLFLMDWRFRCRNLRWRRISPTVPVDAERCRTGLLVPAWIPNGAERCFLLWPPLRRCARVRRWEPHSEPF